MNSITTGVTKIALMTALLFVISACDSNDGPLEKAGQSIDKAATDAGNKIEDTCEDAKKGLNAKDSNC